MTDFNQGQASSHGLANAPLSARIVGAVSGLFGDVLQGWAIDLGNLDARLALEVYIDGAHVCLVRADQYQPEFNEGDGFHGFSVQLKSSWVSNAKQVAVRVANQGPWLGAPLTLPTAQLPTTNTVASSQVWYGGGLTVGGWAWDDAAPHKTIEIRARKGDRIVARTKADRWHPALIYRTDANHGFSLDLPWELANGELHELHLESDTGQRLNGSPITVCCRPEGLGALVQQYWPNTDDAAQKLLIRLARDYDQRCPRTAGFSHYPQWFELFQKAPDIVAPTTEQAQAKLAVLIYGEADLNAQEATRESIAKQRWPVHLARSCTDATFSQALEALLEEGAEAVLFLQMSNRLASHAVDQLLPALIPADKQTPAAAWVYADCDLDSEQGQRTTPWLKPAWDLDLFLGVDLFSEGALFRRDVLIEALRLMRDTSGTVSRHKLTAAAVLAGERRNLPVAHVPQVLVHRRYGQPDTPAAHDAQSAAERIEAMQWLANELSPGAQVSKQSDYPGLLRTQWPLPAELPKVSLIIPTRDQYKLMYACMEGLLNETDYPDLELIVVDNETTCPQTLEYFSSLRERGVKILPHPYPFNYATLNNRGVELATGELIGLINNDIEILHPDWLKEMVSLALRPKVGAVGAKLLWPNGMVQHAGVVIGINGLAAHTGNNWLKDDPGYLGFNQLCRRQSAVTTACLIMKRALYLEVRGMDEVRHPVAFNDVDMCLRINQLGYKLLWTPFARLIHAESASRGKDISKDKAARAMREQELFIQRWGELYRYDPCYHPALNTDWALGNYSGLNLCKYKLLARV
ncbi:GT2 family glycosyltransferase [Pseudomonas duriflava]|uniref:GT2 family glycosyltransferase n=1 Tax=Pseudomonas duriflava TaxID=459528 RepID=A0A562PYW9_9PSED|nr:glycosyltransferase [Pseudomonas duriflava]TWI49286.1 GT2 family glycosyltransferase [Pseudomonas duriflava]